MSKLNEMLHQADAIIVGAGSGLSTAAGLSYSGERFEKYFFDYIEKYHMTDMYSSAFYPFKTDEERWAYMSRHVYVNRYEIKALSLYKKLLDLVKDKEYFIITTNCDHQFYKSGFDPKRIFATQGDYGYFQCSRPCHNTLYNNREVIEEMVSTQSDFKIKTDLLPYCPKCGEKMDLNLRKDDSFVEDENWHKSNESYVSFIGENSDKKILFLELGVGMNTPGIIKYAFWRMTYQLASAKYACISQEHAIVPEEIIDKSLCIQADLKLVLNSL